MRIDPVTVGLGDEPESIARGRSGAVAEGRWRPAMRTSRGRRGPGEARSAQLPAPGRRRSCTEISVSAIRCARPPSGIGDRLGDLATGRARVDLPGSEMANPDPDRAGVPSAGMPATTELLTSTDGQRRLRRRAGLVRGAGAVQGVIDGGRAHYLEAQRRGRDRQFGWPAMLAFELAGGRFGDRIADWRSGPPGVRSARVYRGAWVDLLVLGVKGRREAERRQPC